MSATPCEQALSQLPRETLDVRTGQVGKLFLGVCGVAGILAVGCGDSDAVSNNDAATPTDQVMEMAPTSVPNDRADVCERVSAAYEQFHPLELGTMVPSPPLESDDELLSDLISTFGESRPSTICF